MWQIPWHDMDLSRKSIPRNWFMEKNVTKDRIRKQTGRRGEDEACRFLVEKGHTILKRNWRSGSLEIDIISCDRDGIHFVEVKSRCAPLTADPSESVNMTKQQRIARAAGNFLNRIGTDIPEVAGMECFFDVVTVVFDRDSTEIEYYPQAYIPTYI